MKLVLSTLPKTWVIDIDGVIFVHNNYLTGEDKIIPKFISFYRQIPKDDYILLITSREEKYKNITIQSLKKNGIRFDKIIFKTPRGERILVNDKKPHGLKTAIAISTKRDAFPLINLSIDKTL